MFDQFKRTLTKLLASVNERANVARARGTLERLEDRVMLSATYGDFGPPPTSSPTVFAAPQQQRGAVSYTLQSFSGVSEVGRVYGRYGDQPLMQSSLAPQRMGSVGQRWELAVNSYQSFAAPPPAYQEMFIYRSGPGYSSLSYVEITPQGTLMISSIQAKPVSLPREPLPLDTGDLGYGAPPPFNRSQQKPNSANGSSVAANASGATGANNLVPNVPGNVWIDPGHAFDNARNEQRSSGSNVGGKITQGLGGSTYKVTPNYPFGDNVLAGNASTGSELLTVPQILSRETTTASVLNAVARELAFQEFSASLFQPNATASLDRASVETVGRDVAHSDLNDGLIVSSDESTNTTIVNSSDTVAREREAVDAVLDELEDVDTLMPTPQSHAENSNTELPDDSAFNVLGIDEAEGGEGGMVLLPLTADDNGNGLDLTPVYAEHVERLTAPAKMEASIGIFYQAMDLAPDDAPLVDVASQTSPASQAARETKSTGELPSKREQSGAGKAAMLIGATTLTGALVWMGRGGRVARQNPTAQKRRVTRG